MKLVKAMATVAGLTMVSRVAGFIRDILTAAILGAGPIADAFFVALKLPNFFRRVTAEGAFSVSFVPLYSKKLAANNDADIFASQALSFMTLILSVFTVLMMVVMPIIIMGLAPGFEKQGVRFDLAVELSRITFPYLLLVSLTALFGGVLNARGRYGPFAAAPILFNICLIIALLIGTKWFETVGHALSWGIFAAGIAQLAFMIFFIIRQKVKIRFVRPRMSPDIKKLLVLMGPGVLGAGVMHVNLFADMIIASFMPTGSISYLYYADRLNQLPLGVVGIAVGTALLPLLSKAVGENDKQEAHLLFNRSLEYCFLLALPAAVALMVIPDALIKVLFERGQFETIDTATTSLVLIGYAIGLPAYIAAKVFSTVYWANEDTMSPVKVSIIITVINIVLAIILSQAIGVVGIAASTGLVAWLQITLLKRGLKGQPEATLDSKCKTNMVKIFISTCIMAAALFIMKQVLGDVLNNGTQTQSIMALMALVASGLITYALAVIFTGAVSIQQIKTLLSKKRA